MLCFSKNQLFNIHSIKITLTLEKCDLLLKFLFLFFKYFAVLDRHKQLKRKLDVYEYLNLAGMEKQRRRRNDYDYLHLATGTIENLIYILTLSLMKLV